MPGDNCVPSTFAGFHIGCTVCFNKSLGAGIHEPRHIHVYDGKRRLIGRLDVDRLVGIEGWTPDRKLIKLVQDLINEGRL